MTKRQQKSCFRIGVSLVILLFAIFLPFTGWRKFLIYLLAYLPTGGPVIWKAAKKIRHGQLFDENFLMSLATIGAFSIGKYSEAIAVMLFNQVGVLFEQLAVGKSRKSITALMNLCPDIAHVERDGHIEDVDPYDITVHDVILVKPGERIPLDGVILSGLSSLDTSALTGESLPQSVEEGTYVLSGSINLTGVLRIDVSKEFAESTVAKILELVENATNKKASSEQFITRFSKYYTPFVVGMALILAFICPLVIKGAVFQDWLYRGLIFLVISCPCALVISVPLSFFGGIGGASKAGILVKGSNYLEYLSKADTILMDKTGTLTKGTFQVTHIQSSSLPTEKILEYCSLAEAYSTHPIALSLRKAYNKPLDLERLSQLKEIAGQGIEVSIDAKAVLVGNETLMRNHQIQIPKVEEYGTIVYLAVDGTYEGYILISDELKPDAKKAIKELKLNGFCNLVMLTGDQKASAKQIAKEVGIETYHAELLPAEKAEIVERYKSESPSDKKIIFVGDGLNDAPVLALSDVGIAMGGLGSDAAIEASDIVIMTDEPSKISTAVGISRKTVRIVYQNIIFALGVKFIVLILGALGFANMWLAIFADVGVAVIAILNATRALSYRKSS